MSAKDIFDRAVMLKPGQTMLVPCHDFKQQESLRVSLAYQRRTFLNSTDVNFDVVASKVQRGGKPFVAVCKLPRIDTALIIEEDGKVETISLKPTPASKVARDALNIERLREAMREDGMTEEEIMNYFLDSQETSIIDTPEMECQLKEEGK